MCRKQNTLLQYLDSSMNIDSETISTTRSCLSALRRSTGRSLREWNLFSDHPIWSPTLSLHEQRLATRLFLVILLSYITYCI